jgi:hypothetical protein
MSKKANKPSQPEPDENETFLSCTLTPRALSLPERDYRSDNGLTKRNLQIIPWRVSYRRACGRDDGESVLKS